MEISELEYLQMKEQIAKLKDKIDSIGGVRSIRDMVKCLPYEYIKNMEDDIPIFVPVDCGGDAWNTFLRLAKILHTQDWRFFMDSRVGRCDMPFIRTIGNHSTPTRISQLSSEQILLSVQMLNELIPIYNKYFQKSHESILYKPDACESFQSTKVSYVSEEGQAWGMNMPNSENE